MRYGKKSAEGDVFLNYRKTNQFDANKNDQADTTWIQGLKIFMSLSKFEFRIFFYPWNIE